MILKYKGVNKINVNSKVFIKKIVYQILEMVIANGKNATYSDN